MNSLDDRIPALLERVDLDDEVSRRAGPAARVSGDTSTYHCPGPEHADVSPSFTVKDGRWRCWSQCDRRGDAIDLAMWLDGLTKAEAIDQLARQVGMSRPEPPASGHPNRHVPTRQAELLDNLLDSFLAGRAWDREIAVDQLGLHAVLSAGGRARMRFPFRRGGQVVHHQDRAVGDAVPKWLNPSGPIPCPYHADSMARASMVGGAFILEGVSDVVGLLHTWPDAIAVGAPGSGVFKTAWVPAFAGLTVVVIGDNDPAGQKFRERTETLLRPVAVDVHHIDVPEAHNDLDAWRAADPEAFGAELLDRVDALGDGVEVSL